MAAQRDGHTGASSSNPPSRGIRLRRRLSEVSLVDSTLKFCLIRGLRGGVI